MPNNRNTLDDIEVLVAVLEGNAGLRRIAVDTETQPHHLPPEVPRTPLRTRIAEQSRRIAEVRQQARRTAFTPSPPPSATTGRLITDGLGKCLAGHVTHCTSFPAVCPLCERACRPLFPNEIDNVEDHLTRSRFALMIRRAESLSRPAPHVAATTATTITFTYGSGTGVASGTTPYWFAPLSQSRIANPSPPQVNDE